MEICGTLWNLTSGMPRTIPQPLQNLVEPWWNPEKSFTKPLKQSWTALAKPRGNLVEPWSNPGGRNPHGTLPQTTPDHPAALAEPGGSLVEPWWSPVEAAWKPMQPQTTPDHPATLAEPPPRSLSGLRPQLSAVGEKQNLMDPSRLEICSHSFQGG